MYADDTKILSKMVFDEYATKLQLDLDNAFKWTQDWLLLFNTSKYVVMHYGHSNKKFPYFIDGKQLEVSEAERDLHFQFKSKVEKSSDNCHKQNKSDAGVNQKIFWLF